MNIFYMLWRYCSDRDFLPRPKNYKTARCLLLVRDTLSLSETLNCKVSGRNSIWFRSYDQDKNLCLRQVNWGLKEWELYFLFMICRLNMVNMTVKFYKYISRHSAAIAFSRFLLGWSKELIWLFPNKQGHVTLNTTGWIWQAFERLWF